MSDDGDLAAGAEAAPAAVLAATEAAYRAVPPLQAELEQLQELPQVQADFDAALATGARRLAAANEQLANLRREEALLAVGDGAGAPPPRPPARPVRVIRFDQEVIEPVDEAVAPAAPAPRPDPAAIRNEIKQVATRFARQRLNAKDPSLLATFNFLARDPDAPPGKLLAVLDWEAVFVAPLHERETVAEQSARLDRWRAALVDYAERLRGDIQTYGRQYESVLPLYAAWQARRTGSGAWDKVIADAQGAQAQQIAAAEQQIAAALLRIAALRREAPAAAAGAEAGAAGTKVAP